MTATTTVITGNKRIFCVYLEHLVVLFSKLRYVLTPETNGNLMS